MTKDSLNAKLRDLARGLSPKTGERNRIGKIYDSFNDLFGINNCIQIGSYPRYTSISPVHDLDILYVMGDWNESSHNPGAVLNELLKLIEKNYKNPTDLEIEVSIQSHSVTVAYLSSGNEVVSVDIVPAYIFGKNEFQDCTYKVPEVIKEKRHSIRKSMAWKADSKDGWIKSDPRGYIKIATLVGENKDFRKAVKIVKKWKENLKDSDEDLKLKSFHIEQVIAREFLKNSDLTLFDAIFYFFTRLPEILENPYQIQDRANGDKFIDDYLADLTEEQKEKIVQARDHALIFLEEVNDTSDINALLLPNFYERHSSSEKYLFDFQISMLINPAYGGFKITAEITDKNGNYVRDLTSGGIVEAGRYLKFKRLNRVGDCSYKWKVKNDNSSTEPRGDITNGNTKNVPEHTRYLGWHYIECYAIEGSTCVARSKQFIILNRENSKK
ncbi:MAG: hypothetical protein KA731_00950 [Candidatus Moranbacteria bacterium]|nr:hypothetical protein [Candidatus Moranbacteria bacterium]MBP6034028.1 hypothetical protein [Candidatus Moranbacteria bacterium]